MYDFVCGLYYSLILAAFLHIQMMMCDDSYLSIATVVKVARLSNVQ